MNKPSLTQLNILRRMAAADSCLRRVPGGFWITSDVVLDAGIPVMDSGWVDIGTVRALERRGWVDRANEFAEEWRDTRRLTEIGWQLIRESDAKAG